MSDGIDFRSKIATEQDKLKETILNKAKDLMSCFLYYDRKEDEDLAVGDIGKAIKTGVITVAEIMEVLRKQLECEA